MTLYKHHDISMAPLQDKTIAMIGYGNQGCPQALNLKDSGIETIIGLRTTSPRWTQAQGDGFEVYSIEEAVSKADVVMLMVTDEAMSDLYKTYVAPILKPGQYLGFCHGMAILYNLISPPPEVNVFLLAPKAHGRGVRNNYLNKKGALALVSVHQDPTGDSFNVALAYGKAIGCGYAGILETTFKEETETNHFGEQTVLCGGLSQLCKTAFEVLVEAGYSPEVAYYECLHEVKLLADLIHEGGISGMRERISKTALYGDITQGPRTIDGHVKESMRQILADVQSGKTVQAFLADAKAGYPAIEATLENQYHHTIEKTGRRLRELEVI